ncbi:hypothetical protein KP509_13G005100 [Ceratopteris richardii]|uniref:Chromo domain-containing protein n=1 Tax=Ceratopteris richardii TaxID=49495 RepID=A0A8T2TI89_CERRI|nr:hypothetical protein KP509_13G005100 [Ceratopteris richardii]
MHISINSSYHIGDKVWLLINNLQTLRPRAKLDHKRFGSFTILVEINLVTFKLQLPSTMRIHRVFHVSILEFLVHWKGYDIGDHTWELVENLQRAPIKVREFHKKNPMKPRPENMTTPRGTRRLRGRWCHG